MNSAPEYKKQGTAESLQTYKMELLHYIESNKEYRLEPLAALIIDFQYGKEDGKILAERMKKAFLTVEQAHPEADSRDSGLDFQYDLHANRALFTLRKFCEQAGYANLYDFVFNSVFGGDRSARSGVREVTVNERPDAAPTRIENHRQAVSELVETAPDIPEEESESDYYQPTRSLPVQSQILPARTGPFVQASQATRKRRQKIKKRRRRRNGILAAGLGLTALGTTAVLADYEMEKRGMKTPIADARHAIAELVSGNLEAVGQDTYRLRQTAGLKRYVDQFCDSGQTAFCDAFQSAIERVSVSADSDDEARLKLTEALLKELKVVSDHAAVDRFADIHLKNLSAYKRRGEWQSGASKTEVIYRAVEPESAD
jgi:hypothetical protein